MTIHETTTKLSPEEVIERGRTFFALARTPYASFTEQVAPGFLKLFLEVGEIVIGCLPQEDGTTIVRGSASRGENLLTSFFTTLAPPHNTLQELHRYRVHEVRGAAVEETVALPGATAVPRLGSPGQ